MRKIFSAENITTVSLVKDILASHGIPTVIRNRFLGAAMGELPPIECWPELWLIDEDMYGECRRLIDEFLHADEGELVPWCCPVCGEEIDGQFNQCWRCNAGRPESGEK